MRSRSVRPRVAAASAVADAKRDFNYGEAAYWDDRYKEDGADSYYDWIGAYDRFQEFIEAAATRVGGGRGVAILDLGCGNARLSEDMYDDGFLNITAVDISQTAISMMQERNADRRPGIRWVVGNAFDLDFEAGTFDLVIDKSTMDALSCEDGKANQNMVKLTSEVARVLRPGGAYLVFSATEMASRSLQLPHLDFDTEIKDVPMPFSTLQVGTAVKRPGADKLLQEGKEPALRIAVQHDAELVATLRAHEEAEQRLKEQAAGASFDVLD